MYLSHNHQSTRTNIEKFTKRKLALHRRQKLQLHKHHLIKPHKRTHTEIFEHAHTKIQRPIKLSYENFEPRTSQRRKVS